MKNALKNFDGVIAGAMMIVTILLVIVNVITRKLCNYIIIWSEEIATSCFVYSVFIGAATTQAVAGRMVTPRGYEAKR